MIKPLGDKVLIKRKNDEQTISGIIIPEVAKEKPLEGVIVATGQGKFDETGKFVPMTVEVGQKVMVSKYGGIELEFEGEQYLLLKEDEILGILD
jgi:chaperonin GroES